MSKKNELDKNKELAKVYYLQGESQTLISEKLGVSRKTIANWIKAGNWEEYKAAKSLSRKEIVVNLLRKLNVLADQDQLNTDAISKVAAAIERIDKKTNVVTIIEVLEAYNKWLLTRMKFDKELSPELVQRINYYQDLFISEQFNTSQN